jgi:hypothetical protein
MGRMAYGGSLRLGTRWLMAYYEDLALCDYFGLAEQRLVAVGWIDANHAYAKGPVTVECFGSLSRLVAKAWQPFAVAGRHVCQLCVFTGGPSEIWADGDTISMGSTNVFVPSDDWVYVAPSLVLHYIDAHQYLPPDVFWRAVEKCPPMRSVEYLKALSRHGINRLSTTRR